jgi:ferric-dicitrate binding protein FerR (iron transport regulator)
MNWDLLARYITKNATDEEIKQFEKLISESAEHKEVYESAYKLWEESEHFAFEKEYDVNKEWSNTAVKIRKKKSVKRNLYAAFRYAAVVLLTILVSYQYFNQASNQDLDVAWHKIYVPKGEQTTLTLADGTKVNLNSETHFSYPANYSAFNRKTRLNGEAFFDVVKDPDHPFEVESKYQTVKVFGTGFNVKAYDGSDRSITTLLHGKVSVYLPNDEELIALKPNQQSVLNHSTQKIALFNIDNDIDVCWKDGVHYFKNIGFEELIQQIERWYGVKIVLSSERLKDVRFTGKFFKDQTVWEVLDLLKLTLPFDYTAGKRTIEIKYKSK